MYIKDFLKFPLICNIAVIIPFSYSACDITTFFLINICLAGDLFRELKVDLLTRIWFKKSTITAPLEVAKMG